MPTKFGIDKRYVEYSALVRSGQLDRSKALEEVSSLSEVDPLFIEYVKKRLNYSDKDFDIMMNKPLKSFRDYETYIPFFVENIDKFIEMSEKGMIPSTFIEKILKLKESSSL